MNKLAIVVTSPPTSNLTASAINVTKGALADDNIELLGVFFYQDGVSNGNSSVAIPSDEYQASKQWQQLHQQYSLPLHLCITAAEKRGMSDSDGQHNIDPAFTISGLGELVELATSADKVLQL